MSQTKSALVIVMSNIARDPRVRRQIDWLAGSGWEVDTIGLDNEAVENVRDHFPMAPEVPWTKTRLGTFIIYGLLPHRKKFKTLTQNRIPDEVQRRVRSGQYELIIFNDRHFVPWVADRGTFTEAARKGHIHLDLHEYFVPTYKRDNLWRIATTGYYTWGRALIGSPIFTTRSTVSSGIGKLYSEELGIQRPVIVRNSPEFVDQRPSVVPENKIRLLHHGKASWDRGLREMIDAMRALDERFSLTLMLFGSEEVIADVKQYAADLEDRVCVVPPVPMRDLSKAVNVFDVEVMFFPPVNRNLHFVLPNKLFEAVQGRLALVIGPSPMMVEVVGQHANGVVTAGWSSQDLARTLRSLTGPQVTDLKSASDRAAPLLCAERDSEAFLQTIDPSNRSGADS